MIYLITPEEVAHIKARAITIDPIKLMREKKPFPPPIKPYHLKSRYSVSYSIDLMPDFPPVHHVSVGHEQGKTDPADAEQIAKTILGSEYFVMGAMSIRYTLHFYSCSDMKLLTEFLSLS